MNLNTVLNTETALKLFEMFVKKEHNEENLKFYLEVLDFETKCQENLKVFIQASYIHNLYVVAGSKFEINISDALRKSIVDIFNSDTQKIKPTVFLGAKEEIFNLMEKDSFPRFKRSPLFKTYLALAGK